MSRHCRLIIASLFLYLYLVYHVASKPAAQICEVVLFHGKEREDEEGFGEEMISRKKVQGPKEYIGDWEGNEVVGEEVGSSSSHFGWKGCVVLKTLPKFQEHGGRV